MSKPIFFNSLDELMNHFNIDADTLVSSDSSYVKVPMTHHSLILFNPNNGSETFSIEFAKEFYGVLTAHTSVAEKVDAIVAKFTSFREQAEDIYDTCDLSFNVISEGQYRITVTATKMMALGEKEIEVSLDSKPHLPNPIDDLLDQLNIDNFFIPTEEEEAEQDLAEELPKELPEARVEHVSYALAYCPTCDAEHEVSVSGSGEETCVCLTTFKWSTVS